MKKHHEELIEEMGEEMFLVWLEDTFRYYFEEAWCPLCNSNIDRMPGLKAYKKLDDDMVVMLCPSCPIEEQEAVISEQDELDED